MLVGWLGCSGLSDEAVENFQANFQAALAERHNHPQAAQLQGGGASPSISSPSSSARSPQGDAVEGDKGRQI